MVVRVFPKSISLRLSLRWLRKGLLTLFLALLVLGTGHSDFRPSAAELITAPYQYSLVGWELGHLPDKWFRKLKSVFSGGRDLSREQRAAQAREFFDLGLELSGLNRRLQFPDLATGDAPATAEAQTLAAEIEGIEAQRQELLAPVEETIEGEIHAALKGEGFGSRLGGIFPPVDVVFSGSPQVLVLSPRDRIERQDDFLLDSDLNNAVKEDIEERLLREEDLSALVASTGGVALYPSVVTDAAGLHNAVVITAHEWLHHWFFFKPLGRGFWSSPEMTTLNETAASIGGEELGDLAFIALTGEPVDRTPRDAASVDRKGFDFNEFMHHTRLRAEEFLAQGQIEEAEAYMEERRQELVARGYLIRKLNQAYFAFHGTYATTGASISPIGGQLRELRDRSDSVEDFLKTVAEFGSYAEFLEFLEGLRAGEAAE
jgi:hypothetical protein